MGQNSLSCPNQAQQVDLDLFLHIQAREPSLRVKNEIRSFVYNIFGERQETPSLKADRSQPDRAQPAAVNGADPAESGSPTA